MKILIFLFVLPSLVFAWTHVGSNIKGWNTNRVVFGVNTTNCVLSQSEMLDIIDRALAAWNGVHISGLEVARTTSTTTVASFIAGTATDTPVILCDPSFSAQGVDPNVIPGAAFRTSVNSAGNLIYGGVLLNAQVGTAAELSQLDSGTVALILAHEMGHALGLGHSSAPEALMYYSVSGKTRPLLTEDDMLGLAQLYPKNEFKSGQMGCAAIHSSNPFRREQSIPSLTLVLAFILGVFGLGRIYVRPELLP